MGESRNLAARAAGWSARHRRAAILGWLGFVVLALAVGSVVGQRSLTEVQAGNGQSKLGTKVYYQAFPFHTGEQVLVQGGGSIDSRSPVFTAAVRELVARLRALRTVGDVRSPLSSGNRGLP